MDTEFIPISSFLQTTNLFIDALYHIGTKVPFQKKWNPISERMCIYNFNIGSKNALITKYNVQFSHLKPRGKFQVF